MTPDDISALKRAAEAPLEAGGEDLAKVAADLAAAFTSDPIFNWFLRDDSGREPARQRVFRNLTGAGMAPAALQSALLAEGISVSALGGRLRACTHLDVQAPMIGEALDAVRRIVRH